MKLTSRLGLIIFAAGLACGWATARMQVQPPASDAAAKAEARKEAIARETPLDMLDWLVGDWVSDDDGVTTEFSCDYTKNGSFLVRPFRIVRKNGQSLSGMQIIGWDPAREGVRSWTFDSDGGFGEDTWTQSGNHYTSRAKYTLPDGGIGSAMHVMTYVNADRFTWKSVSREIDGQFQPDTDEITLVRKNSSGAAPKGDEPCAFNH
jgi:hypothetical protein